MLRTYSELIKIPTFIGRFNYLRLDGDVGKETFGYDRYLNQILYHSQEWKRFRKAMIVRDCGFDLAHPDRPTTERIILHHLNPITLEDIEKRRSCVFDPENVVCTTLNTHNAIHYGDEKLLYKDILVERTSGDTCPWRKAYG